MKKITQQSIYAMLFALLAFTGINKLNAQVSTFAGSGTAGAVNGNNLTAQFNYPQGIAVAPNGDVYVADEQNNQIRKISGVRKKPGAHKKQWNPCETMGCIDLTYCLQKQEAGFGLYLSYGIITKGHAMNGRQDRSPPDPVRRGEGTIITIQLPG